MSRADRPDGLWKMPAVRTIGFNAAIGERLRQPQEGGPRAIGLNAGLRADQAPSVETRESRVGPGAARRSLDKNKE
jgi:hypothetical protein